MLTESDTDVVRTWLASALEIGRRHGQTAKALADHCGVRPQAVSGWLKTGRITKSNLTKAASYFGHSPTFGGMEHQVRQQRAGYAAGWPFRHIDRSKLERLSATQLAAVEAAVLAACAAMSLDVGKRLAA